MFSREATFRGAVTRSSRGITLMRTNASFNTCSRRQCPALSDAPRWAIRCAKGG